MPFQPDPNLAAEHRDWLSAFPPQYFRNWEKVLSGDPEAAMCEAAVRRLLQDHGCAVEPYEELTGAQSRPDFRCIQAHEQFYVEVKCIGIDAVTKQTGLPPCLSDIPQHTTPVLGDMVGAMFRAAVNKAPQCSDLGGPALVAVGTLHQSASSISINKADVKSLLTGYTRYQVGFDPVTGRIDDGKMATSLDCAVGLRPAEGNSIQRARCSISGLLLCGFGLTSPEVLGVLLPEPVRPFPRHLLPRIEFARLGAGYESGQLSVEWT